MHNFSMYNLSSHQCTAYWWNETEGDLSASSFVSCIIRHLEKYCLEDTLPITIYSDGCGYQNRNQYLSNALSNFAIKHKKIIEQKFLEKGHTQMEYDSAHAKIETKLENKEIFVPEDYITVTKEARKTVVVNGIREQMPFDVEYLHHSFFKNYADETNLRFNSIRPGNKAFDPTVSQLRALIYLPSGAIKFKTDFNDEYEDLPRSIKPFENYDVKPLHISAIKIKQGKWKHLQSLKSVIPVENHSFYDNLPYFTKKSVNNNSNTIENKISNKKSKNTIVKDKNVNLRISVTKNLSKNLKITKKNSKNTEFKKSAKNVKSKISETKNLSKNLKKSSK